MLNRFKNRAMICMVFLFLLNNILPVLLNITTKLIIVLAVFLTCTKTILAQEANLCSKSTEGKEFWFGFMENRMFREEYRIIQVTVTAKQATDFNITIGRPESPIFNQNFSVLAEGSLTVEIPWRMAEAFGSENIQEKGVHLTSDNPVSVFAINWDPNSTDITPVYPVETLGKDYLAMCYEPNIDPDNPTSGNGRNSEFLVVAAENQTLVKITPSKVTDQLVPKDSTFEIFLNKGDVYQVQSENNEGTHLSGQGDLTGSRITADKPIALFSGALSTTIPNSQCCWDHLFEQIPPIQSWGREYYTVPLKTRAADRFRILASKNNTTVQIFGEPLLYLNEGEFYEFQTFDAKQIFSNNPVLVAQFSQSHNVDSTETGGNGDPFMIILNPAGQGVNTAIFETYGAPKIVTDTFYIAIKRHFVNIVALTSEVQNIRLNGQPVVNEFQPYPSETWSFAQIEIPEGKHVIENVAGKDGFVSYIYGFGGFESYGFGAGFNLDLKIDLGENIEFFKGDTLLLCYGDTLILDAGPQFSTYKWSTVKTTQTIAVVEEGFYKVEAISSDGCQLADSVSVKVSTPKADLDDRNAEVCYPMKVLLRAEEGYVNYLWQNEFNETLSINKVITADNTGDYRLTVIDKYRCVARDTFSLTVFPVPNVEIKGDHLICGVDSSRLSVSITGVPDSIWNYTGSFEWSANSQEVILSEENQGSVKINVTSWGDFEISYKLTTVDNCDTVITFPIRFHPQPVNDFEIEDDPSCSGYSKILTFTGFATSAAEFDWDVNGRIFLDTLDQQNRVYLISEGARQTSVPPVSLVINDKGCISDQVNKQFVNINPNFTMEADKTRGCDFLTVSFTSELLISDNVEFVWTFDDTEIVRQQNYIKNYPDTGYYKVNLTITNPVTQCRNSFTIDSMIKVFPTPIAEISADPDICYPGSALLIYTHHMDSSFTIWEFNGNQFSGFDFDSVTIILDDPLENVKLTVNEFGCVSEPVEMRLKRKPSFDFQTESKEGCQPYSVEVYAETSDNYIDFTWITDSLPYPTGVSNLYNLTDTGRFDISLIAYSSETGCVDTLVKPDWIWVHRNPFSKFEVDYKVALIDNSDITFINYSERAVNYFWDFGDGETSEELAPVHIYNDLGEYTARLYAESVYGCADTFELVINIIPSIVYAPNAFRPDSDIPENRTFMPVAAGVDESRFILKIFNRWGEMVFESNSLFNPWNGTLKNGKVAPMGNYVWISNYFDIQGIEHNEKGQVLLIR